MLNDAIQLMMRTVCELIRLAQTICWANDWTMFSVPQQATGVAATPKAVVYSNRLLQSYTPTGWP